MDIMLITSFMDQTNMIIFIDFMEGMISSTGFINIFLLMWNCIDTILFTEFMSFISNLY